MKHLLAAGILVMAAMSYGSALVSHLYPYKDGESGIDRYDASAREIKVEGAIAADDRLVGWITYQLQDVDLTRIDKATLGLLVRTVSVEGQLKLYALVSSTLKSTPPQFGELKFLPDSTPAATVAINRSDIEKMIYIDVTMMLKTRGFYGIALGANAPLEASVASKESPNRPLILLGYDKLAGPQGPVGPMGPSPAHQWVGPSLQFRNPDGKWGSLVNLQGPQGIQGPKGETGLPGVSSWIDGPNSVFTMSKVGIRTTAPLAALDVNGTMRRSGSLLDATNSALGMKLISAGINGSIALSEAWWMDAAEVCQADYFMLMKYNPSRFLGGNRPVENVTWFDALLYCNGRSIRDGLDTVYSYAASTMAGSSCTGLTGLIVGETASGYRLPSADLAEYAYRAEAATEFFWGKNMSVTYPSLKADTTEINSFAVWRANSFGLGEGTTGYGTHAAASTIANEYGIFDMAGNVREWTADADTAIETLKIVKGGDWAAYAAGLRAFSVEKIPCETADSLTGFRCVLPVR